MLEFLESVGSGRQEFDLQWLPADRVAAIVATTK
jgi:hypothetical protein